MNAGLWPGPNKLKMCSDKLILDIEMQTFEVQESAIERVVKYCREILDNFVISVP